MSGKKSGNGVEPKTLEDERILRLLAHRALKWAETVSGQGGVRMEKFSLRFCFPMGRRIRSQNTLLFSKGTGGGEGSFPELTFRP